MVSLLNTIGPTTGALSPHHVLNQSKALGAQISTAITGMENVGHADESWRRGERSTDPQQRE